MKTKTFLNKHCKTCKSKWCLRIRPNILDYSSDGKWLNEKMIPFDIDTFISKKLLSREKVTDFVVSIRQGYYMLSSVGPRFFANKLG